METLNLNVNLKNLTAEEREALMRLVEKSQEKKNKVWKPKSGETYWSIDSHTGFDTQWCDYPVDIARYEFGNCFETREEAEEELTRRKMVTKWKRLSIEAGEGENKWDGLNCHWGVGYSNLKAEFSIVNWCNYKYGEVYFPAKDSLLAAIKELGEDNVKRYILGVRD